MTKRTEPLGKENVENSLVDYQGEGIRLTKLRVDLKGNPGVCTK